MGWQIEKDVLYPGRVVVPGKKGPRSFTFKPADLAAIEATNNSKIADGWNIPLAWEHQNEGPDKRKMLALSQAQRIAEQARGVFGCSTKFVIRQVDGKPRLRAILAGDDDADLAQFAKVKHVSPEIAWDWMDSDGKVWAGPTITHIAATARPVQRHQDAVQLSQNPSGLNHFSTLRDFLFEGENTPRVAGTIHPLSIRLSLTDYAEPPMADTLTPAEGKQTPWERAAASLATVGIQIGDGKNIKDAEHFADLVDVACMNAQKPEEDPDDLQPEDDEQGDQPAGDLDQPPKGANTPGQPMQMSLEEKLQKRDAKLIEKERAGLMTRAERVAASGALTPADGDALVDEFKTLKLSLNAETGELERSEAIVRLEALEKVKPGTGNWAVRKGKRVKLSHTRPVPRSPLEKTPNDPKEDAAFVDEYEKSVGRGKGE